MLHQVRAVLNHELVVGRSHFEEEIEVMTRRQTRLGEPGHPRVKEQPGVFVVSNQEH
jgi:putative transposase